MELKYIVESSKYKTVKDVLKARFGISDRLLLKLKRANQIFVNNEPAYVYTQINLNDEVVADISFNEKSENIVARKMDLEIVFEDEALLILNKPAGLPLHPSMAHFEDSLSNGVQYYFEQNNICTKIRPVNRLDRDTSGLVIFAKSEYVQERLIRQMEKRIFEKWYKAILLRQFGNTVKANLAPLPRVSRARPPASSNAK